MDANLDSSIRVSPVIQLVTGTAFALRCPDSRRSAYITLLRAHLQMGPLSVVPAAPLPYLFRLLFKQITFQCIC